MKTASLILAAGRGSRMKGYTGNKALLPLLPGKGPFDGRDPILLEILTNLPPGPRAVVVNHRKDDLITATRGLGLVYHEQPELNGTGGALLAARPFLEKAEYELMIVTMGDVPFVRKGTYLELGRKLEQHHMVVLGFRPKSRKQYGLVETAGDQVRKITEWKYWKDYPAETLRDLVICNSGIYALRKEVLLSYLPELASRPHLIEKEIGGKMRIVKEFFITDLVEYMARDRLFVGYILAKDEEEVMGVDDPHALRRAQEIYRTGLFREKAGGPAAP